MRPLTRDQIRLALRKGQGRVVQHLREHGAAGIEDELLEACRQSLVYDTQSEGVRADWLLSLIDLSGSADFYRDKVLEALPSATILWDAAQLLGLALEFARRGCPQARDALYATFDRQQFGEDWLGGTEIVALDGVAGMLHVAEVIGARLTGDPEYWVDDLLLSQAFKQCGEGKVMAALEERARDCPAVRAYLDGIVTTKEKRQAAASLTRAVPTVEQILTAIEGATRQIGQFLAFGRTASECELEQVFNMLVAESRREQMLRYLRIFHRRALPRLDDRIFALAASKDEELQEAALAAIAASQDRSIRDLGLRLLRTDPTTARRGAIALFRRNYVPGDHKIILAALPDLEMDEQATHSVGLEVLDVAEHQPDPDLALCLEWVYEHTPCSYCRLEALRELMNRRRAPAWMLEEAAWDCAKETRDMAREALGRTA